MFSVPMIVFMDDVLILTKDREQMADIYVFLENELSVNYHLKMNLSKTDTGRFAEKNIDFCGWEFTGGYACIKQNKVNTFLEWVKAEHTHCRRKTLGTYIKRLNCKTTGFGHYYKFGQVKKQFEALDTEIRKLTRQRLKQEGRTFAHNALLAGIGLKCLSDIRNRIHTNKIDVSIKQAKTKHSRSHGQAYNIQGIHSYSRATYTTSAGITEKHLLLLEKINLQLAQLPTVNRKLLRITEELFRSLIDV